MSALDPILDKLAAVAHEREEDVSVVLSRALKVGIDYLWRESVLDGYLAGRLSRDEAVQAVGSEWVELAEETRQAVFEDIEWARSA